MKLRNIGIIAHVDAGKTTVTERMLEAGGAIRNAGSVDGGSTVTDFDPRERAKGITIQSATVRIPWRDHEVNLIDTPGHADFAIEVERSLRVLDGAVLVLDAVAGVQPQTEKVWRQADRHGVPRLAFLNKIDKRGASLDVGLDSLRERLGATPVLVAYPVEEAWVDLLDLDASTLSPQARVEAESYREALVEACAEHSDGVASAWLAEEAVPRAALEEALRRATATQAILPVMAGSAMRDLGVRELLDLVVALLPAPQVAEAELSALCFKVSFLNHGVLAFTRVYAGELRKGDKVWRAGESSPSRVGRIVRVFGDRLETLDVLRAGDIGAIVGGDFRTGDTIVPHAGGLPLAKLERMPAVMHLAIEAGEAASRDKLQTHLERMLVEDPSLELRTDPETGEQLLGGLGELHLEMSLEKLAQRAGGAVRSGAPKVALRSRMREAAEVRHRHVKQSGGPGQFAEVSLELKPASTGDDFVFEDRTKGGAIPAEYVRGVEAGARQALQRGPLGGWPVVGVQVILRDGVTHPQDSSELAFTLAARAAVDKALASATMDLLEPSMAVEVTAPGETVGKVVGDLQRRRGAVTGLEERDERTVVQATVPLAELFGYANRLASLTHGRGTWSATPHGDVVAPASVVTDLLRRAG